MDRLQLTHPDTEDHCRFREKMRAWVEKDVAPYIQEWEEAQDYPRDLHQRAYAAGSAPYPSCLCSLYDSFSCLASRFPLPCST